MRFYAFTMPGLEEIAAGELRQRLEDVRIEQQGGGMVCFAFEGDPRQLLEPGTVEDVFALLARDRIAVERLGLAQAEKLIVETPLLAEAVAAHRRVRPGKVKRPTFRVIVQRQGGGQEYIRQELGKRVARAIEARFPNWKRVPDGGRVELWVRQQGEQFLCGLRLSDRTMRHRTYKQANIEASLRPVVARAMVLLSEPAADDVFLDPMCGAGTILIERGEHSRYAQLLGGDVSPEALAAARINIGPRYKPIKLRQWDATALPLPDASVSRIVCNLPFGRKVGSPAQTPVLYERFAAESARVLRPGGVMVLLTGERSLLNACLAKQPDLRLEQLQTIFVLGRRAFIFKSRRIE